MWIGTLFILFTLALSVDVVRLVGALIERIVAEVPPAGSGTARTAIARVIAGTIAGDSGGGAVVAALRSGLGPVAVKEVRVKLARLPKALNGLTLVQLSDIHIGPTLDGAFMEGLLLQQVNRCWALDVTRHHRGLDGRLGRASARPSRSRGKTNSPLRDVFRHRKP